MASLIRILSGALAALLLAVLLHNFYRSIDLLSYQDGVLRIKDLAYYLIIAKALWLDGAPEVYQAHTHFAALSRAVGEPISIAMPLGITPVAFALLLPFVLLMEIQLELAFTVWMSVSIAVFFWGAQRVLAALGEMRAVEKAATVCLFLFPLISFLPLEVLILAQASVMAAGLLMLLWSLIARPQPGLAHEILGGCVLLLLCYKVHYAAIGAVTLLLFRKWRIVAIGAALAILVTAAMTFMLGPSWLADYRAGFAMFSEDQLPPHYAGAFALSLMSIFRSAFQGILEDRTTITISMLVFFTGVVWIAYQNRPWQRFDPRRAYRGSVLFAALYLLFSPYAGAYEDLLLMPLLAASALTSKRGLKPNAAAILTVLAVTALYDARLYDGYATVWLWLIKLAAMFLLLLRTPTAESPLGRLGLPTASSQARKEVRVVDSRQASLV